MGLCFSDDGEGWGDWEEYWRFHGKLRENEPNPGETKKEHFKRCFKWLTEEENYNLSKAKGLCRLIWECHVYKKGKRDLTPEDIKFPLEYYLDRGFPKHEIKSVMVAFFAKRKFFREKKKVEINRLKNKQIESFKVPDNTEEQYKIGTKIVPESMRT